MLGRVANTSVPARWAGFGVAYLENKSTYNLGVGHQTRGHKIPSDEEYNGFS